MTRAETVTSPAATEVEIGRWVGQSVPRSEDRRLLQGAGHLRGRRLDAPPGLRPLRPLAARPRPHRLGGRHGARSSSTASTPCSPARRPRRCARCPSSRSRPSPPDGSRSTRSPSTRSATRATPSRSCSPRPASWRATPRGSSRSSTSRCRRSSIRVATADPDAPLLHEQVGTNVAWHGVYDWGDIDWALAERRPRRARSTACTSTASPLPRSNATARVVNWDPGTETVTVSSNNQMPMFASMVIGPTLGIGQQPAAVLIPGHRRRRSGSRSAAIRRSPRSRCSRARRGGRSSGPSTATDHMLVGRPRQRAHVPRHRGAR